MYVDSNLSPKLIDSGDILSRLSKREGQIFSLVQRGLHNQRIADELSISRRTVENTLSFIYAKTGIKNRRGLENL
jgi:DNA-binding NarL/FixJ family response regulator